MINLYDNVEALTVVFKKFAAENNYASLEDLGTDCTWNSACIMATETIKHIYSLNHDAVRPIEFNDYKSFPEIQARLMELAEGINAEEENSTSKVEVLGDAVQAEAVIDAAVTTPTADTSTTVDEVLAEKPNTEVKPSAATPKKGRKSSK